MPITESDLRKQYEDQTTEQLLVLRSKSTLTDVAKRTLDSILDERGISVEVREASSAAIAKLVSEQEPYASLGARLMAQIVDTVIAYAALMVPILLVKPAGAAMQWVALPAFAAFVGYLLLADGLPKGQSLGKKIFGTACVDEKTRAPCGFGQSFVRNLLLVVLGLIDWVFIFGPKRQRLGDMLAGTIVVDVEILEAQQAVAGSTPPLRGGAP